MAGPESRPKTASYGRRNHGLGTIARGQDRDKLQQLIMVIEPLTTGVTACADRLSPRISSRQPPEPHTKLGCCLCCLPAGSPSSDHRGPAARHAMHRVLTGRWAARSCQMPTPVLKLERLGCPRPTAVSNRRRVSASYIVAGLIAGVTRRNMVTMNGGQREHCSLT